MSQPACPGAARAPRARDWPAPAHPQHQSPGGRRITTAGLVASTRLPIMSVDAAWRGTRRTADGSRQRWALATGHACTPDGPLTVTFTRRASRTTIHPATVDGLWAAAVTGHYTAARCHTPAAASARQLTPVTPRPPPR